LKKGEEQWAQGLVAPARLLFERAADLGLAQAAMALGATYDAAELNKPNLRGISADDTQAKRWYERARQLGASEAEVRLRRLGAM
jgi:TPR repeat protein